MQTSRTTVRLVILWTLAFIPASFQGAETRVSPAPPGYLNLRDEINEIASSEYKAWMYGFMRGDGPCRELELYGRLREKKSAEVLPLLVESLVSESEDVRLFAAFALRDFAPTPSRSVLAAMESARRASTPRVREMLYRSALRMLDKPDHSITPSLNVWVQRGLDDKMAKVRELCYGRMLKAFLWDVLPERQIKQLVEKAMADPSSPVQVLGVKACTGQDPDRAFFAIKAAFEDEATKEEHIRELVRLLGWLGSRRGTPLLVDLARRDFRTSDTKRYICMALGDIGDERGIPVIVRDMEQVRFNWDLGWHARSLKRLGYPKATGPYLVRLAEKRPEALRAGFGVLLRVLGRARGRKAVPPGAGGRDLRPGASSRR